MRPFFVDSYALTAWYDYSSSVRRKDLSPLDIHQDCSTAPVSLQLLERSELSAHEAHLKLCVHVLHRCEMISNTLPEHTVLLHQLWDSSV